MMTKVLMPLFMTFTAVFGQLCTDVERNGDLEQNSTYPNNWHNDVGAGEVTLSIVPGPDDVGHALKAVGRTRWWASPRLDIETSCYAPGEQLTFTSKIKLLDANMQNTECTPGQIWGRGGETWVCPTMALKLTAQDGSESYIDVASLVAPYQPEWNSMYGTYTVTQEFMEAATVSLIWYKSAKQMSFILDDVSVVKEEDGCATLIKNGGGEEGDTRGWQYYGNDGVVHAVEYAEGFTIGDYHLASKNRISFDDGIRTMLDTACLDMESLYEISAKILLVDSNSSTLATCDYSGTATTGREIPRCPMIHLGARNPGGPRQYRPIASINSPFDSSTWNELNSVFGFFSNELTAEETFLFISGSPPGIDILLEDVSLTRIASNSHAPSLFPSLAPISTDPPTSFPSDAPSLVVSDSPSQGAAEEVAEGEP